MKSSFVVLLSCLLVCFGRLASQPATSSPGLPDGISFFISLTNATLLPGITNIIRCTIVNGTTHTLFLHQPVWEGTALSLSNRTGQIFALTGPPFGSGSARSSRKLNPGETYEWVVRMQTPDSVKAGQHTLYAARYVVVVDKSKTVGGGELRSNPVEVDLRK